ncbi:hypothetical protein ACLOJK_015966 [Asimina triloba]
MGEGMGNRLQHILRSLCQKTQWKYAVFWKLKHRARMVLTWEDSYYEKQEQPNSSNTTGASILSSDAHDSNYRGDPLGLAVAKMSYLVHSLGEGIIGQIAFTGKHRWIFADEPGSKSWPPLENIIESFLCSCESQFAAGLQAQFSAGIKTIAVVAVVPYGVVQLGSSNPVVEDLKLVSHIRHAFGLLQNSSASSDSISLQHTVQNTTTMAPDFNDCLQKLDLAGNHSSMHQLQLLTSLGNYYPLSASILPIPGFSQQKEVRISDEHLAIEALMFRENESAELPKLKSPNLTSDFQRLEYLKGLNGKKYGEMDTGMGLEKSFGTEAESQLSSYNFQSQNAISNNFGLPTHAHTADHLCLPSVPDFANQGRFHLDGNGFLKDEASQTSQPLEMEQMNEMEKKSVFPMSETKRDLPEAPLIFSPGSELHEALGSAFKKEEDVGMWCEAGLTDVEDLVKVPQDESVSCLFSGSENLLEAVVANACISVSNPTSDSSWCQSGWSSVMTTGNTLPAPNHAKSGCNVAGGQTQASSFLSEGITLRGSAGCSSDSHVLKPSGDSSSLTPSACSGLSERQAETSKIHRKRAKPGESCRPRPRDRQLIQDRVKELREIVPNGSKCSIDALLERTIKHMIFLQSVTSHAEKLKRCAESKLSGKGSRLLQTCNQERGASWALEVGSQFKACPIIVENLNMSGQMLVEMLCEDCNLFLEIADVIRGLGFTILKGVTESRFEKTWACFVIEVRLL